jgi:hypothetical protein
MDVAATDHVVLYALRNIAGGCAQAGYEFFRANVGGLGSAPNRTSIHHFACAGTVPRRHRC